MPDLVTTASSDAPTPRFAVIMAGGRGERFWPVSRERTPKQLVTLLGTRSFLQATVDRILPIVPAENILVITNAVQSAEVCRQLPELPAANVIAEPCGRDTCAAVGLAAAVVGARSESAVMAVLPADHVIPNVDAFQRVLLDAFCVAESEPAIVTIGIQPTEPATGYGYIQVGAPRSDSGVRTPVNQVVRFVEKPPKEKAEEYLRSGAYRWNAGMFIWSYRTIAEGLRQHQPVIWSACEGWQRAARSPETLAAVLAREYPTIPKISIDYALMEHARNVCVVDGAFGWDDLGAWTALARHLQSDSAGNCAVGDLVSVDAARNIVFDARTRNRTPITLVGVSDVICVQTDDAVLIASKSDSQKIKDLVKLLGADPRFKHLV